MEYQQNPSARRRQIPSRPTAKAVPDDVSAQIVWLTWELMHDTIRDGATEDGKVGLDSNNTT
jgi:hypothetical protein